MLQNLVEPIDSDVADFEFHSGFEFHQIHRILFCREKLSDSFMERQLLYADCTCISTLRKKCARWSIEKIIRCSKYWNNNNNNKIPYLYSYMTFSLYICSKVIHISNSLHSSADTNA